MNVVITGGSGFIGRKLTEHLKRKGHQVQSISLRGGLQREIFDHCDAVVNLAGEPVAQRWTAAARGRILSSRVNGTHTLVRMLADLEHIPSVLVSASAVGYYGSRGDEVLTEDSKPGSGFLSDVTVAWEREARGAQTFGVRVVCPRIGVVLDKDGGALQKMLRPFRFGVGGRLGTGKQWMPWIHAEDLVSLIDFAIRTPSLRGPVNAVAPRPVTNAEFTRALATALDRPAVLPVPAFALKLLFGKMSQVILGSQRVTPDVALRAGFKFRYTDIDGALSEILAKER